MSSEVKGRQNASNIECLRPGGGASKKTELPNVIDMEETNLQIGDEYCGFVGWEDLVFTQFH